MVKVGVEDRDFLVGSLCWHREALGSYLEGGGGAGGEVQRRGGGAQGGGGAGSPAAWAGQIAQRPHSEARSHLSPSRQVSSHGKHGIR